jgi:hypothetical protein
MAGDPIILTFGTSASLPSMSFKVVSIFDEIFMLGDFAVSSA